MLNEKQLAKFYKLFEEKIKPAIIENREEFSISSKEAREFINQKNLEISETISQLLINEYKSKKLSVENVDLKAFNYHLIRLLIDTLSNDLNNTNVDTTFELNKVERRVESSKDKIKFAA